MQPPAYNPTTDFSADEAANLAGRSSVRTANLDTEFANLELTLDALCANIALLQRDDGALHDLIVTAESLSANVKALFGTGGIVPRGVWLTATAYAVRDVVETGAPPISYICVVAHVSGVFAVDRAAGKWMVLGAEPGAGVFTTITLTTGGLTIGTNNAQDLAATANRFRDGYFGRTVFATTSVVTPLVGTATAVDGTLMYNGGGQFSWSDTNFYPQGATGSRNLGKAASAFGTVFTQTLDSGTVGSLSLKNNNGVTTATFANDGVSSTQLDFIAQNAGNVVIRPGGANANASLDFRSKGVSSLLFSTDGTVTSPVQFSVLHTASATRNVTITGSNGGNPTIGVTAGSLAITPAVVLASSLTSSSTIQGASTIGVGGTTPAVTGAGISFPAAQSASADANTLDDYEEGTWTPALTFGGAAVGMTGAFSGSYVKIGRLVFCTFSIALTAKGSSAGNARIGGLAFSRSGTLDAMSTTFWTNLSTNWIDIQLYPFDATNFELRATAAAATNNMTQPTEAAFANNSVIEGAFSYIASA